MLVLFWLYSYLLVLLQNFQRTQFQEYSSVISNYVNIAEIASTQHHIRLAYNKFPRQKMLGNDRMETASGAVTSIWLRNDIEKSTWRIYWYFIDFHTSKFPSRIDIIISTWIRLSKSMKPRRTFYVEFWHWINGESTKMCPLGINHLRKLRIHEICALVNNLMEKIIPIIRITNNI